MDRFKVNYLLDIHALLPRRCFAPPGDGVDAAIGAAAAGADDAAVPAPACPCTAAPCPFFASSSGVPADNDMKMTARIMYQYFFKNPVGPVIGSSSFSNAVFKPGSLALFLSTLIPWGGLVAGRTVGKLIPTLVVSNVTLEENSLASFLSTLLQEGAKGDTSGM